MEKAIVTSQYISIEGGFYGLIDSDGNQYMVENLPQQLTDTSKKFKITFEPLDVFGFQMWGKPIRLISFTTG